MSLQAQNSDRPLIQMKITYLVANYNNGIYIQDCIDSLNNQTSDDWFCIVCDDASTDESIQIIEKNISDKISLIKNEKNIGYIGTLKRLIDLSDTDIVGILDSDDALYPDATHEVLAAYKNNLQCGFVYTKYQSFDKFFQNEIKPSILSRIQSILYIYPPTNEKPVNKTALIYGPVSHLKTFRKKDYFKTSMLDDEILYAEDTDLVYKMEEVTDFYFIDKKLYKYRVLPNSQSHGMKENIGLKNHVIAREKALLRRGVKGMDQFLHNIINFSLLHRNYFIAKICYKILSMVIRLTNHSSGQLRRY